MGSVVLFVCDDGRVDAIADFGWQVEKTEWASGPSNLGFVCGWWISSEPAIVSGLPIGGSACVRVGGFRHGIDG